MRDEAIVLEMFHGGYSVQLISDKINVPAVTIHQYLKRRGISRPRCAIKFRPPKQPHNQVTKDPIEGTTIFSDCLRVLTRMLPE